MSKLANVYEDENFAVHYDESSRKYRVSYFEDGHFKEECSFSEYRHGNWIKCAEGQMPENFDCYKSKKIINVLVTTAAGKVTKVQRSKHIAYGEKEVWLWGRIYGEPKAWMPLPEAYKE